jgi:hypothetical protein
MTLASAAVLSAQAKAVVTPKEPPVMREGPSLSSGPVPVKGGNAARLCTTNLGARPIRLSSSIIKGERILAFRTDPLDPRKQTCLEYPMPAVLAGQIVGLVFVPESEGEKTLRTLANTLQVVEQSGTVVMAVNPVLLLGVQLPVEQ